MASTLLVLQSLIVAIEPPSLVPDRAGSAAVPSLAARALIAESLPSRLRTPVATILQCLVKPNGVVIDCIEATGGGTTKPKIFRQRQIALDHAVGRDPALHAARDLAAFYRLPPVAERRVGIYRSVLLQVRLSDADAMTVPPPGALTEPSAIRFDVGHELDLSEFYPPAARRAGAQTQMVTTCRILADRSLLCRNAVSDLLPINGERPAWRDPAHDAAFAQATRLALAATRVLPTLRDGGNSVGRDVRVSIRWVLPN